MGRGDIVCAADCADSTVGREDDDGGDFRLECSVEIGEAFDIEHVDLVDEEDTWDELGDALVDVFLDHFIDLGTELISYFSLFRLHELTHHGHDILAALCMVSIEGKQFRAAQT